jgi:hypothetical protein
MCAVAFVFIEIFGSYLEICFAYGFPLINHTISFYENKVTIVSYGQTGFKPRWRQEIFSCPKLSRPAPETITLPIQWVPGFFPERPRREVNTQLHLVLRLKMSGATLLRPPVSLHGLGRDKFTFAFTLYYFLYFTEVHDKVMAERCGYLGC